MINMEPGAQAPHEIVIPDSELTKLRYWSGWSKQHGFLGDFLKALKTIQYRLTWEPFEWGEPRSML